MRTVIIFKVKLREQWQVEEDDALSQKREDHTSLYIQGTQLDSLTLFKFDYATLNYQFSSLFLSRNAAHLHWQSCDLVLNKTIVANENSKLKSDWLLSKIEYSWRASSMSTSRFRKIFIDSCWVTDHRTINKCNARMNDVIQSRSQLQVLLNIIDEYFEIHTSIDDLVITNVLCVRETRRSRVLTIMIRQKSFRIVMRFHEKCRWLWDALIAMSSNHLSTSLYS